MFIVVFNEKFLFHLQTNSVYKWTINHNSGTKDESSNKITNLSSDDLSTKSIVNKYLNQNRFCEENEKLMKIKSKIRKCISIAQLYGEVRAALNEIDEFFRTNANEFKGKLLRKYRSYDSIEFVDAISGKYGKKYVECGTQTINIDGINCNNLNGTNEVIIPPPPPLPSFSLLPLRKTIQPNVTNIPKPPPLPIVLNVNNHSSTILSTNVLNYQNASNPASIKTNMNGPPPLPMPSADLVWFKGNSKCPISNFCCEYA